METFENKTLLIYNPLSSAYNSFTLLRFAAQEITRIDVLLTTILCKKNWEKPLIMLWNPDVRKDVPRIQGNC